MYPGSYGHFLSSNTTEVNWSAGIGPEMILRREVPHHVEGQAGHLNSVIEYVVGTRSRTIASAGLMWPGQIKPNKFIHRSNFLIDRHGETVGRGYTDQAIVLALTGVALGTPDVEDDGAVEFSC
jgi:hypothetical protein